MKPLMMAWMLICMQYAASAQKNTFNLNSDSVHVGQTLTTYRIFFVLGKAPLKPESTPFLDSLTAFLQQHPGVSLEIGVHSDNRANPRCCDHPTLNRAESIRIYLVQKGITMERLSTMGYGDKKLLISDAEILKAKTKEEKEALHAKNRRVEFKILRVN